LKPSETLWVYLSFSTVLAIFKKLRASVFGIYVGSFSVLPLVWCRHPTV